MELCFTCVTNWIFRGGVYNDTSGFMEVDHIIEVAGWGETAEGVKYWICRNSWGTYWYAKRPCTDGKLHKIVNSNTKIQVGFT